MLLFEIVIVTLVSSSPYRHNVGGLLLKYPGPRSLCQFHDSIKVDQSGLEGCVLGVGPIQGALSALPPA